MEENNRPQRRIKNRPPYDLRRKVLLKNFLREQMSPMHLQTSTESSINHEVVHLSDDNSSENDIIDIENVDSTSDVMSLDSPSDAADQQNNINKSFAEMEIDDDDDHNEAESSTSSPFKSTLIFDFAKITEIKLSRFNSLKRKTPSLTADDVKVIANKNSVHLEGTDNKNIKSGVAIKESHKDSVGIFKRKYNNYISSWKRKPTIELGKKRGIIKAKEVLQSSKFPFKQQVDKGNLESKSSKLNKVRKMIAAVQHVIKGKSPKFKSTGRDNQLDFTRQASPQRSSFGLRQSSDRFSKYGSFNNGILIDFENEENDEDIPERVRVMKDIKKRQYCRKYKVPYEDSFGSRSVRKDPNNRCKNRRKTCSRSVGSDVQEHDRPWAHNSDISWSLNQIRKLEKANERLREENKLLSESLSSIMADVDVALVSRRRRGYGPCTSDDNSSSSSKQGLYREESFSPKCKVLRSRSVQDRGERRREIKSRLSSRSMCHQQYSRFPPRTLYRAKPCLINPYPSDEVPLPYPDMPPVLSASLDRSSAKSISRRSSMPERVARRPLVHRRSSFTLENKTFSRQSLLSLPTEAFY